MDDSIRKRIQQTEQLWLQNTDYKAYDGTELFSYDGSAVFSVLDMWRYCYSHLANQGAMIAEFIVSQALNIEKAENVSYWTAYDMTYRGMRIEVKETSYVHPWNKRRVSKQRTFSIAPSNNDYWNGDQQNQERYSRQSDVYVFCLNNNQDIDAADPLNLNAWRFYVVQTRKIDEYASSNGNKRQKTISIGAVRRLAGSSVAYGELKQTVETVISEIVSERTCGQFLEGSIHAMPKEVTLDQFLADPEQHIRNAVLGEYLEVKTGHGLNAVIIDEVEWTMLTQALKICTEHPEWTISE